MQRLQTFGFLVLLVGVLYAGYWVATYKQDRSLDLGHKPLGSITKQQFVQAYPNLDRAYRFLDFRPFDDDYSLRCISPGQFISNQMKCHAYLGIALCFLGLSLITFRSAVAINRVAHYVTIIGLGVVLGIAACLSPGIGFLIFFVNGFK